MEKKFLNIKKASILTILAAFSFSIMSFFVKMARINASAIIVVFFRFGVSFFYVSMVFLIKKMQKKGISLKTNCLFLHFSRSMVMFFTMILFYFSLKYISLVSANLLLMTNAIFIPILAAIFFHKKTNKKHWIAVVLGFIGIAFILKPGLAIFNPKALIALCSAIGAAVSFMLLRHLIKGDHHYVCMFYLFLGVFILSSIFVCFFWKTPDLHTLILLVLVAIFAIFYQEFLMRAAFYAPAKITSALLYTGLIFSAFWGWFFLREFPDIFSWIGIITVTFSSILIIRFTK